MVHFPLKVAVASTDGAAISQHFGHAKDFWVYEVSPAGCRLLEHRRVEEYSLNHVSDALPMPGTLKTLEDCHAVFVAQIGDKPREQVEAAGIAAISSYANKPIDTSLVDYATSLRDAPT